MGLSIGPLEIEISAGRSRRRVITILTSLVLLAVLIAFRGEPSWVASVEESVQSSPEAVLQLSDHTDFEWDRVHVFAPYTDPDQIDAVLGQGSFADLDTAIENQDGIALLVFCKAGKVVESHDLRRGVVDFASCPSGGGLTPGEARFKVGAQASFRTLSLAGD